VENQDLLHLIGVRGRHKKSTCTSGVKPERRAVARVEQEGKKKSVVCWMMRVGQGF